MAGRRIGRLFVELFAPKDRLKRDLKDAEQEVRQSSDRMKASAGGVAGGFDKANASANGLKATVVATGAAVGGLITKLQSFLGVIMAAIAAVTLLAKWWQLVDKWTQRATRTGRKYRAAIDDINDILRNARLETQRLRGEDDELSSTIATINAQYEAGKTLIEQQTMLSERFKRVTIQQLEAERDKQVEAARAAQAAKDKAEKEAKAAQEQEELQRRIADAEAEAERDRRSTLDERTRLMEETADRLGSLQRLRQEAEEGGDAESVQRIDALIEAASKRHRRRLRQIKDENQAERDAIKGAADDQRRVDEERFARLRAMNAQAAFDFERAISEGIRNGFDISELKASVDRIVSLVDDVRKRSGRSF